MRISCHFFRVCLDSQWMQVVATVTHRWGWVQRSPWQGAWATVPRLAKKAAPIWHPYGTPIYRAGPGLVPAPPTPHCLQASPAESTPPPAPCLAHTCWQVASLCVVTLIPADTPTSGLGEWRRLGSW